MENNAKKDEEMKGISRISSKKSGYGWYVRTYLNGKTFSKFFSDSKYGGKKRALKFAKKAKSFAELQLKPYRSTGSTTNRPLIKRSKNNSTGVIGVSFTKKKMQNGNTYCYFMVNWREDGKSKNTSFSCNKYGKKEAFKRAVQLRDKMMRKKHGAAYEKARKNSDAMLPTDAMLKGTAVPKEIFS